MRAVLRGRIADRNDHIERLIDERRGRLRLRLADVDADLRHGPNGQRMDESRRTRAGGDRLDRVAVKMVRQRFRHLAARRVAGAEKENALHGGSPARNSSRMALNSSGLSIISQCPVPAIFFAGTSGNWMWNDVALSMSEAPMAS